MTGRLEGKVCIVTGSGGSIGRASALRFAAEGAQVVGCDINTDGAEETVAHVRAAGFDMLSHHPANLTDASHCQALVDFVLAKHGRLDVLLNNAGKAYFNFIEKLSEKEWNGTIDEELNLVFQLTKAAWPHLAKTSGTIVNMASTAGWIGFKVLGGLAHAAAKGGIIAMTRQLAMEGRAHGIRANSISPGPIETPSSRRLMQQPEWRAAMSDKIMRGTLGLPEEIANVALFLASDESSFVNGADIIADGGATAW